jgi:hypothetical protein
MDDVSWSTPIEVAPYNVGIETAISSYTY